MHEPITTSDLARLVRQARAKLNVSQTEFGRLVGKTQTVISRYEAGAVEPPGSIIMYCMHITGIESYPEAGRLGSPPDAKRLAAVEKALGALQQAVRALNGVPPV